jgi:hypothetical protein
MECLSLLREALLVPEGVQPLPLLPGGRYSHNSERSSVGFRDRLSTYRDNHLTAKIAKTDCTRTQCKA